MNKQVVGIDIAKNTLQISISGHKKTRSLKNNDTDLTTLINQLQEDACEKLIVMENTGGYEKLAHKRFCKAGFNVHIAQGRKIHFFSQQKGYFAKTDAIDAEIIRKYGEQDDIEPTPPFDENAEVKRDLVARRAQLVEFKTAEKNRLEDHLSPSAQRSVKRSIKSLERELELIEKEMETLLSADSLAVENLEIMQSFKGIGKISASIIMCALPEIGTLTRSQIACLAGLAPQNKDSGSKSGKRRTVGGRGLVRKLLYMSALSSMQWNKTMKTYYNRLIERGKLPKVALVALMRKIIITLNAMVRDKKKWDEAYMTR